MIGTHDSYTFLTPKKKIFNLFRFLWRTQDKNIIQQKKLGVEYFDIRVRLEDGKWRVCHGIVDLALAFNSIEGILRLFKNYKVRLILERGDSTKFEEEIEKLKDIYDCLSFSCVKKGWKVLVDKDPVMVDYSYVPFLSNLSFWKNIKRMKWFSTIKKWAKKHNPDITKEMIEDKTIYFMDYVK